jgi:hypothetical protein
MPFGATMHVIWIGLNDFVTAGRPNYDSRGVKTPLPAGDDYQTWREWSEKYPTDLPSGVGVFPAVAEIQSLVELINSSFPDERADNRFMVIDLPSVYHAIRYIEGLGEPEVVEKAKSIDPVMHRYNAMLESLVQNWPDGENAPAAGNVHLVQMSRWMHHVSEHLDTWGLFKQAQDHGVRPFYDRGIPPAPKEDPVASKMRQRITTSDLAHPTEAVYKIMARYLVSQLLQNGHTLGRLNRDTWPEHAPFGHLPFDVPRDV